MQSPSLEPPVTGGNSTADRAIDILLLFDDQHPVLSAGEVATRLGMSRSTTYRYLQSLRAYHLLEDDEARGGYRLGPKIFALARTARRGMGLLEIALPTMRTLAQETGEAVLLTRRSGAHVVCIERVESPSQRIRLSYERGQLLPLHAGASAKVLLAFADPDELDELLASSMPLHRYTDRTVTDPGRLRRQLERIRRDGYAVTSGEVDQGVRGVAAPIFAPDGGASAGLSVAGMAFRLTDDTLDRTIHLVRTAANAISNRLRLVET